MIKYFGEFGELQQFAKVFASIHNCHSIAYGFTITYLLPINARMVSWFAVTFILVYIYIAIYIATSSYSYSLTYSKMVIVMHVIQGSVSPSLQDVSQPTPIIVWQQMIFLL